jgi:hypothetical protein
MQGVSEAMQATTILAADALQQFWQVLAVLLHTLSLRADAVVCRGNASVSQTFPEAELRAPIEDSPLAANCSAEECEIVHAECGDVVSEQLEVSEQGHQEATQLVNAHIDSSKAAELACSSERAPCVADFNIVESVKGLRGLKTAVAAHFMYNRSTLPNDFRCGYLVDMDEHWITVHVIFHKKPELSSLSLIVFDTLEVDYQRWHRVGLLRSSSAAGGPHQELPGPAPEMLRDAEGIDVVTLCKMLGIHYDIAFLAPVCDMRRLTLEEEEHIRMEKKSSPSKPSTVYYDRCGKPFRKIIVQPILQSEQDGTCKSRALAVLAWLLELDDRKLAWYVASHRELFHVELRAIRGNVATHEDEKGPLFGSLMSTGRCDKFGRDVHLKVCHADTLQYNQDVDATIAAGIHEGHHTSDDLDATSDKEKEFSLQHKREEELDQIRNILCQSDDPQRWRSIEDHEARWHFLEETCFFGHNLGYKKIKKAFPREDILRTMPAIADSRECCAEGSELRPASEDTSHGFGATRYLRKYLLPGGYVTHEADPMFHQPLENFFNFLCGDEQGDKITVPFYMLPFPESFMGLSLDSHALGANTVLALESDPEWHKTQKVSDYVLPSGNTFLNNPISYNKSSESISLPVKLFV